MARKLYVVEWKTKRATTWTPGESFRLKREAGSHATNRRLDYALRPSTAVQFRVRKYLPADEKPEER